MLLTCAAVHHCHWYSEGTVTNRNNRAVNAEFVFKGCGVGVWLVWLAWLAWLGTLKCHGQQDRHRRRELQAACSRES